MVISKGQLIGGIVRYIDLDVVPAVEDKALKTIIIAATVLTQQSEDAINKLLANSVAKFLLRECESGYDISATLSALKTALADGGSFPITISPIPLILKTEKTLTFTKRDIDILEQRIQEVVNNG